MRPLTGRQLAFAAALFALAAPVVLAGCGSGSDEETIRHRLEAGVAKLGTAESLTATVLYEVVVDGEESTEPEGGCVNVHIERGPPLRIDIISFDESSSDLICAGGYEAHEVIIVGDRAWVQQRSGKYQSARIAPALARSVTDESGKFDRLLSAASGLGEGSEGAAIEADGMARSASRYFFDAPASAFSNAPGSDSTEVEFDATVDRHGYLRELIARIEEDEGSVTVTQTYEDLGRRFGIGPPPADAVKGPPLQIDSRKQLQSLLGSSTV